MDLLGAAGASVAFIGAFYVWSRERRFLCRAIRSLRAAANDPGVYIDRSSDSTIRRRTVSLVSCCLASGAYLAFAASSAPAKVAASPREKLRPVLRAAASTLLLFTGPLVERWQTGGLDVPDSALQCWRNFIICPIGEEIFYRGVLFSLLRQRTSAVRIGVSAALFSLSHTHHIASMACDAYKEECGSDGDGAGPDERACWLAAARLMGGVCVYTTLFGLLSGYYYERACEGNIVAITVSHAMCNLIGPPEFATLRSQHSSLAAKSLSTCLHVAGVVGWAWMLLRY